MVKISEEINSSAIGMKKNTFPGADGASYTYSMEHMEKLRPGKRVIPMRGNIGYTALAPPTRIVSRRKVFVQETKGSLVPRRPSSRKSMKGVVAPIEALG